MGEGGKGYQVLAIMQASEELPLGQCVWFYTL